MVDPVLKWAGGKRQLLEELYARFPAAFDSYHEPMVGGGALFFDLEPEGGTVNDANPRLVNFYEQVRDHPGALIEVLEGFADPESDPDPGREFANTDRTGKAVPNYYYQQRALFNRRPNGEEFDELEEAALLLYLNRTCYNGLYRENQSGEFNVPIGRYANPDWVRDDEIRAASDVLQATEIFDRDFEYVREYAEEGDLVYFDPPYEPMSPTANFTEYSAEGFGRTDQKRLLELARELDEQGVQVILSNSGVMFGMYDAAGFHVGTEGATRAINSDADNRDEVDEIVATNVAPEDRSGRGQMRSEHY
ncbi:MAG: Dam family site-specific DNA-(adenine-N6)-methyltransferase [Haloarculaceae archaeon]